MFLGVVSCPWKPHPICFWSCPIYMICTVEHWSWATGDCSLQHLLSRSQDIISKRFVASLRDTTCLLPFIWIQVKRNCCLRDQPMDWLQFTEKVVNLAGYSKDVGLKAILVHSLVLKWEYRGLDGEYEGGMQVDRNESRKGDKRGELEV